MKQKKRKRIKSTLDFFCINAGFKEPYKVILDGNFLHIALTSGVEDMASQISNLLGCNPKKVPKLFASDCVAKELQRLGFTETWRWTMENAEQFQCQHGGLLSPDDCIKNAISTAQKTNYFVATQDNALIEGLGENLKSAFIQFSVSGMHLLPPSKKQLQLAQEVVSKQMLPGAQELQNSAMQSLQEQNLQPSTNSLSSKQNKFSRGAGFTSAKPKSEKKKRPGPRLRNALKAAAQEKENGKSSVEAKIEQPIKPKTISAEKDHKISEEADQKNELKFEKENLPGDEAGIKSHRKRKRRRTNQKSDA